MLDANRSRDMSRVRNAIRLTTSATDVSFPPVYVQNTTVGDPLNVTGVLGAVWLDYESATLRSSAQAHAAGTTMLRQQLGTAKQLTLAALSNPALDADDVIRAILPRTAPSGPRATELHILDVVTHPLIADGDQSLTTRSTRPDTDGT